VRSEIGSKYRSRSEGTELMDPELAVVVKALWRGVSKTVLKQKACVQTRRDTSFTLRHSYMRPFCNSVFCFIQCIYQQLHKP
jgi:hypothetical protein